MITSFVPAYRRPGLSPAQFREHWRLEHAPLIRRLDYIRGYVQNSPAEVAPPTGLTPSTFDGIAGFWWEDLDAARRPATDPQYMEHGKPDEARFLDTTRLTALETVPVRPFGLAEHPRWPGGVKALLLLVPRELPSLDELNRQCRALATSASPSVDRCLLHLPVTLSSGNGSLTVSVAVEWWWRDADRYEAWRRADGGEALEGRAFIDPSRSSVFMAEEHHVIMPPAVP